MIVNAELVEKKLLAADTYELTFTGENLPEKIVPGQYISLTVPDLKHGDIRGNRRDFSVAGWTRGRLTIIFRHTGSGFKRTLAEANSGLRTFIEGPYGVFVLPPPQGQKIVLIAGGIGLTPFLYMLNEALFRKLKYDFVLLNFNSSRERAFMLEELRELARGNGNLSVKNYFGPVTEKALRSYVKLKRRDRIYVSGPERMVSATTEILSRVGLKRTQICTEEFTGYRSVNNQAGVGADQGRNLQTEGDLGERSKSDLEALLKALSDTALVSETNAEGTITYANDKFVEISRYSREELIGQNHRILKSGFHSPAFYRNLWATISRGKMWRGQIKNRAKDGSYYWVDTSIAPILGGDGQPVKYISVRFPITERQQAEEKLKERARQQSVITHLSQEALAGDELTKLFENAVALLGQTLGVEAGAIWRRLPGNGSLILEAGWGLIKRSGKKPAVDAGKSDTMAGYCLATREAVIMEDLQTESRFSDAQLIHDLEIISGANVIIAGQDEPFGVLAVYSQKKRTFSPDDINFLQAVAILLANAIRNNLDRRKDEFLGIASHELKTPLTSIKTFNQLLHRTAAKSGNKEEAVLLGKMEMQLNRLTSLINELLDISRINSGKLQYEDKFFNLGELVEEIVADQQLMTERHKIVLDNGITHSIYGDRFRLGQVLSNLISNAIKYSPEGEKIVVEAKNDREKVRVAVRDWGVGINRSELPHVFERFFQGNPLKREMFPGGLGLGLYICQEVIRRHAGKIWVKSEEGKGSTFYFTIPRQIRDD